MAEFLIYATEHWMDKPTATQGVNGYTKEVDRIISSGMPQELKDERLAELSRMQYGRYINGDCSIQIEDNGYFLTDDNSTGRGWNKNVFALLIVKNLEKAQVLNFMEKNDLYQSRYKIDRTFTPGEVVVVNNIQQVTVIDKTV